VVDKAAPVGSRIVSLEVGGAPLDPAKKYKVAANEFLLSGGDGYTALGKGKVLIGKVDGKLLANEVMSFVRKAGTVEPKVEGRIVYK
jgi:2',3'-cyclic-nucleotide 2'-phosphodiesterase (5'-nucleotidase family)